MSGEVVPDAQWIGDRVKTKYYIEDKICAPPKNCTLLFPACSQSLY
jgi:hypothetical protein